MRDRESGATCSTRSSGSGNATLTGPATASTWRGSVGGGISSRHGKGGSVRCSPSTGRFSELEEPLFSTRANRLIIANSRMVAGEIARYFEAPERRVRVIYNGLPASSFTAERSSNRTEETRSRLGLNAGECAVLFAGSGWERKGLRFAMEAVNRMKNATLLVAGTGRRQGLPASARTRFLGEVTEMRALMDTADVFLLPTIYDPFSNACLEAMAAGLPVITTEANGFAEIMRPGTDGEILTGPDAIEEIAAAIDKWHSIETASSREARMAEARRHTIEENVRQTLSALTGS